jgi:ubiquinone/menaquinone biosynthesis C-methylase UbiE
MASAVPGAASAVRSELPRVLEPEVMDSASEAVEYDAMDHREVNRRFVADFLAARRVRSLATAGNILDLGTGTAQIPIELCGADPNARVVAVDMARSMLDLARVNVARAGFAERIELVLCDAKRLAYPDGLFAAVISNSIVHHIPQPASVLAEIARVAATGGLIFVRDLMRPADEATVRTLVNTYAAGANEHQRQMFDDSLRAALDLTEIRALVAELGFDPLGVQATTDRHWTWIAERPQSAGNLEI